MSFSEPFMFRKISQYRKLVDNGQINVAIIPSDGKAHAPYIDWVYDIHCSILFRPLKFFNKTIWLSSNTVYITKYSHWLQHNSTITCSDKICMIDLFKFIIRNLAYVKLNSAFYRSILTAILFVRHFVFTRKFATNLFDPFSTCFG